MCDLFELKARPGHSLYMVLNDGETFTDLAGCRIVEAPDSSDMDAVELAIKDNELPVLAQW